MVVVTVNGVVISMEERQETNPDELPTSDIVGDTSSSSTSTRSHTHDTRSIGGSSRFGRTSGGSTT